jgi:predicted aspartyl protease
VAASLLTACRGGTGTPAFSGAPAPVPNVVVLIVDAGPTAAAGAGAVNHAYVTVNVCASGSQTQCANIDHVLLDTGSNGLRLVASVLAAHKIALTPLSDAAGNTLEECMSFVGGQTWGPVALADVHLAGETATKLPVQVMNDTSSGAPPPATCGANGTLINGVSGFAANGVLGIGVFEQDCGQSCVAPATPLPLYYGCTAAGACAAANVPLTDQVTNPVALFAADNNGVVVTLPNLQSANGDPSVQGTLVFGIATQPDNSLPSSGITVLGTDAAGDFRTAYNGAATGIAALIDSGTDSYAFSDPSIAVCASGAFVGYYCPAVAPLSLSAVNTGVGANATSSTVDFALADPNSFVAGATAFIDLGGGGGSATFTWGMPFFYGRAIYVGFDQRPAGLYTGPYYAY